MKVSRRIPSEHRLIIKLPVVAGLSTLTPISVTNKAQLLRSGEVELEARRLALGAVEAALSSAAPQRLVREHLKLEGETAKIDGFSVDLRRVGRIYAVGGGKASAAMAEALYGVLGDRLTGGLVVAPKYLKHKLRTGPIRLVRAGHPVPTAEAPRAVTEMLELVSDLSEEDLVFCLLSGGESALMALPMEGVNLEEKRSITKALLKSGVTIDEMNTVRKHLSKVKGGRLAQRIYPATVVGLIISDVVGDSVETVASGPTSPDPTTFEEAVDTLRRYRLWDTAPSTVRRVLEEGVRGKIPESPKPGDRIFQKVHNFIVGNNELACRSACKYLLSESIETRILTPFLQGEAEEAGKIIASIAKYMKPKPEAKGTAIVLGGETTVTVTGDGRGGHNQELVLSACRFIAGVKGLAIAAVDTNGVDGFTKVAGGIVDGYTLSRAKKAGLNVESFLRNNDSHSFLEKLGDTVVTGPTGTNVNDLIIAVRTSWGGAE